MQKEKIIIIGTGIAGISAAVYLAKKGFEIEIFETKNFIGGRTYSFEVKSQNQFIDNGQHLLMSAYTNFLELLEVFGTNRKLKIQDNLDINFYSKNKKHYRLNSSHFSGKEGMLFGLMKMNNLSFSDKIYLIDFIFTLQFFKKSIPKINVLDFLKKNHQGENIINNFWQPMCLAVMNLSVKEADANLFIQVLKKAFFSSQKNSKLIFPTVNLSELISPFSEWLKNHKGKIYFNSRVNKILTKTKQVIGIQVADKIYKADYYISTVQPYILEKIIDNKDLSEKLTDYEYSTIISIYIWIDREIIKEDFAALLDSKPQWIFNLSKFNKSIKTKNHLITLTISNADELNNLDNSEILNICLNDLNDIFPKFKQIKILNSLVIKNKKATFKANPNISSKRLNANVGFKNLFIAGDWTNTDLPATIEGACVSGINAGKEVTHN